MPNARRHPNGGATGRLSMGTRSSKCSERAAEMSDDPYLPPLTRAQQVAGLEAALELASVRPDHPPRDVACPHCKAEPGLPCHLPDSTPIALEHRRRRVASASVRSVTLSVSEKRIDTSSAGMVERLDDDPFVMSAEEWEMVQQYRWEYRDGEPYVPLRDDMYDEGRDAIHAPEGWAYRARPR